VFVLWVPFLVVFPCFCWVFGVFLSGFLWRFWFVLGFSFPFRSDVVIFVLCLAFCYPFDENKILPNFLLVGSSRNFRRFRYFFSVLLAFWYFLGRFSDVTWVFLLSTFSALLLLHLTFEFFAFPQKHFSFAFCQFLAAGSARCVCAASLCLWVKIALLL